MKTFIFFGLTFACIVNAKNPLDARFVPTERSLNDLKNRTEFAFNVNLITSISGEIETSFCAGAILNETTILTSALCLKHRNPTEIMTVFGNWNKILMDPLQTKIRGKSILIHPEYQHKERINDIAMLFLEQPVEYTEHIQPICLPSIDVTPGHKCIVTRYHPENPSGQRSLEARVMSAEECAEHEGYENIDDKQICAGNFHSEYRECQGDLGAPLFRNLQCANEIVGIQLWGDGCAEPLKPGLYTNVYDFIPWIRKTVGHSKCSRCG